jgi:hypothetical protein
MAANYFKPLVTTALGTFTFEYTGLGSSASRFIEDSLVRSLAGSKRVKLFARHAVENMDPSFRELYRDYFKTTDVDAVVYGRFSEAGAGGLDLHIEMTSLTTGELMGTAALYIQASLIPKGIAIRPPGLERAADEKRELENLLAASKGSVVVKTATGRGPGAVYREGEDLTVHVFVNRDASYPFTFRLGPPFGTEFIKVAASTRQFADVESAFADLPGKAKDVLIRGLTVLEAGPGGPPRSLP